jgi:hypothetical protein
MIYDLTGPHPMLSPKAKAMLDTDEDQFRAQVEVAETYLALGTMPKLTGSKATLIKHFLALQVNWQIQIGLDPLYIKTSSSSHTSQSTTYRDNLIVHPGVKLGLASAIRSWGFQSVVRSVRG